MWTKSTPISLMKERILEWAVITEEKIRLRLNKNSTEKFDGCSYKGLQAPKHPGVAGEIRNSSGCF